MHPVQSQLGCPACGREVRTRDRKCPWCGHNLRSNRPVRAGKAPRFKVPGPLILAALGTLAFFVMWLLVRSGDLTSAIYFGSWVVWSITGAVVCFLVKAHHDGASGLFERYVIGTPWWDDVADSWWLGFTTPALAALAFTLIR